MDIKLSFGNIIKHSETLLELTVDEGIDFDFEQAQEYNHTAASIMHEPYGILINMIHSFSVTSKGAETIGKGLIGKKTAILVHRAITKDLIEYPIEYHMLTNPDREVKIFKDRQEAIVWLQS